MKINGELQNLLFSYFHQEHDIMLLDSDFREIENIINSGGYRENNVGISEQLKCKCKRATFTRTVDEDSNPMCGKCGGTL